MIILDKLCGRLGNNIIQLSNIIDIAIAYKHNVKLNVKIKFFDVSIIEEYFKNYNNDQKIIDKVSYFFYKNRLPFPEEIFVKNIEERNKILQKALLIKDINKLPINDLVIHIRSGDIFSRHPHTGYVPPPLSYYIKELNNNKYEKIHIVCEDKKNPVVNKLLGLYKNAIHNKNTLEKDIRLILGASNIMCSVGSFIPSLLLLSNNINFIHTPFKDKKEKQDYYKIMHPWKNTIRQRDYILTYNYN